MRIERNYRGITLIALVITIIVLLILAGISINMLAGDNSILKRASEAKEMTEVTEVEEVLRMAYNSLITSQYTGGEEIASLSNAVEAAKKKGYEIETGLVTLKLNKNAAILGMDATDNKTEVINVIEENDKYYAKLSGRYYEVTMENESINVSRQASNIIFKNNTGEDTIEVSTKDNKISTATNSGKVITVTAKKAGSTNLTVKINGKTLPDVPVTVLSALTPINLDGARVLKSTDAGNTTMTNEGMSTNNTKVATITEEGIVKCGTETGTARVMVTENGTTKGYKITSTAKIVQAGNNKPISGTVSYNNPTIPKGFYAIDTNDAKWKTSGEQTDVNKGLVIMDENGNQFVWIPVQTPVVTSEAEGNTKKAMARNIGTEKEPKYKGLLYNFQNEDGELSSTVISGCTTTGWECREPDVATNIDDSSYTINAETGEKKKYLSLITDILDDEKYTGKYTDINAFKSTVEYDYNEMVEQVQKYGGFYIGRYESSLINGKTKIVSNSAAMSWRPYSANTWYGLYARQKKYADDNNIISVKSNMLWDSQYDAMLNWMIKEKIDVTGNNGDGNSTYTAGTKTKDKLNNIFDLKGGSGEMNMAVKQNGFRTVRGGRGSNGKASLRDANYPQLNGNDWYSSRPTLYIN